MSLDFDLINNIGKGIRKIILSKIILINLLENGGAVSGKIANSMDFGKAVSSLMLRW